MKRESKNSGKDSSNTFSTEYSKAKIEPGNWVKAHKPITMGGLISNSSEFKGKDDKK